MGGGAASLPPLWGRLEPAPYWIRGWGSPLILSLSKGYARTPNPNAARSASMISSIARTASFTEIGML